LSGAGAHAHAGKQDQVIPSAPKGFDAKGVGQRPLPALGVGPIPGAVVAHRTAVLAQLFPEPEPDRAALEVLKKECLASRPLPDDETFTQAIDARLNQLHTKYKEQMKTLLTLNFQTYEDEPVLAA